MRVLIPLIFIVGIFLIGFVAIRATSGGSSDRLKRSERKELKAHREFQFWLADKTAEHRMLGDHFAEIVSAELTDHRKRIEK